MKKTFKGYSALIALLIALLVVTSMPLMAFAEEATDHTPLYVSFVDGNGVVQSHPVSEADGEVVVKATQTTPGIMRYPCLDPVHAEQKIWHEKIIPATGVPVTPAHEHKWDSVVDPVEDQWGLVTVSATCTEPGIAYDYCIECGEVNTDKSRVIEPTGHIFFDEAVYTVDVDGKQVEYIEDYQVWKDNGPEYAAEGIFEYIEDESAENKEIAEWLGVIYDKDATCSAEGSAHLECLVCGAAGKSYPVEKNPYAHNWDGWVVEKAATCDKEGTNVRWCPDCGSKQTLTIEPTEQYEVLRERVVDCYHTTVTYRCVGCNGKVHEDFELEKIPAVTHVFDTKDYTTIDWEKSTVNALDKDGKVIENPANADPKAIAGFAPADCETDGELIFKCVHFDDGATADDGTTHEDDEKAKKTVKYAATGHQYGDWILRYAIGAGDNEYAYYFRVCSKCNKTEELITKDDPNNKDINYSDTDNTFAIDVTGVENGAGTAVVTRTAGSGDIVVTELFGRITWVYELSDGSTFAYAAMAPVQMDGDDMIIKVGGAMTPRGATLVETQVALTDDADANLSGEFNQLAGAKA